MNPYYPGVGARHSTDATGHHRWVLAVRPWLPTLLRNDSPNDHHWVGLKLRGKSTNRDAVGARVEVVAGDLTEVDEVRSGRGYQSHFGTRLHFGLGGRNRIDRIRVLWPAVGTRKGHVGRIGER